jgi:ATP adenylyltransferase
MRNNLIVPNKMAYVRGDKRPDVECILCAIVEKSTKVTSLEVYRSNLSVVALNLYPYTPGHLMIFPKRHVTDLRKLEIDEALEIHKIQNLCLDVLDILYTPKGFTIGYNIGEAGGATIDHLHLHIVPRYNREIGFMDIIGGARIIVEDPNVSLSRVREAFNKINENEQ